MASLIPEFEYDIFISYRQKDNKYDGWVSEFVDNLKKELEATFKEEITVYFDINPHDGLLEIHDVDESLKRKLKCLVFIPIVSRTYCDPKSFAWEHEFKAFVEQASKDRLGLKVTLPNGNVINRVLPVRIHELNEKDIRLCESILGGVLRGIEFVYKSAGVNRPLRTNEDHPNDNLNKSYYRDQINKVANAVEEIVNSVEKTKEPDEIDNVTIDETPGKITKGKRILSWTKTRKSLEKGKVFPFRSIKANKKLMLSITVFFSALLLLLLWYFWPFICKPRIISRDFESSVAVVMFDDVSDRPGFENYAAGATNDIINRLSRIRNLKVVRVIEATKYKKLKDPIKAICKENEVHMVLQGSVRTDGENITLITELIDGEKDILIWQKHENGKLEDILNIQDKVVVELAQAINGKYSDSQVQKQVGIRPTKNFRAYELFLKGNAELMKWTYEGFKEAISWYRLALDLDPEFLEALSNSALANLLISYFFEYDRNTIDLIKTNAKEALSLERDNEIALMSMEGYYIMKLSSDQRLGIYEARDMIVKLKSLIIKNPSSPMSFLGLAEYYRLLKKDMDKASEYLNLSLSQCERVLQTDPSNGILLGIAAQSAGLLGKIEFRTGNYLDAISNTEYSINLVPSVSRTYHQLARFYLDTDQLPKAREVLDQAIANVRNANDRGYVGLIQGRYSMVEGDYQAAEQYWANAMAHLGNPKEPYYDYALLYRCMILHKIGSTNTADSIIHSRLQTPGINSWPESLINFLAGNIEEDDIIKLAQKDWQKCEAFFFMGEKDLTNGDLIEAKKHFENCISTNVTEYLEYIMSEVELQRAFTGRMYQ